MDRPLSVLWYTDTLGDINGVSRFIRNMADQAMIQRRDVTVVTSTAFAVPDQRNIINFEPVFAAAMPKYEQLEIVLPPLMRMLRHADQHRPDLIHVSTPGPVGLVGLRAAKNLRVPLIGTYHTDFPAYVDHLFDDAACTGMCEWFMKWFYGRCRVVLSRSPEFIEPIRRLGIPAERIESLRSGIDLRDFGERYRDESVWSRLGVNEPRSIVTLQRNTKSASTNGAVVMCFNRLAPLWGSEEGVWGRFPGVSKTPPPATVDQPSGLKNKAFQEITNHGLQMAEELRSIKVLYVGRVSVEKNLPLLARAWRLVHDRAQREGIAADLIVVGDGPYLKEMKEALAGRRAHFLGFRHGRELASIYASADVFVFPSVTDTLGQSVMEAQASGLPAVVSDQGGPKAIVDHNASGVVVAGQRAADWAGAMFSLIADGERRARFSAAAVEGMNHRDIGASFAHFWELCERASLSAAAGAAPSAGEQQHRRSG